MLMQNGWWRIAGKVMSPWQWAILIGAVFVAIWLIVRLRSYFREDADSADGSLEMLTQFRALHQEGGLSDDEFRLIRSRLASTAQGARVTERTNRKAESAEFKSLNSTGSRNEASVDLPVAHATAEKEADSERMTEDETD